MAKAKKEKRQAPAAAKGLARAAGSDIIKVGVIGVGGRGNGALHDCLQATPHTQVWALGDLFKDKLDRRYQGYQKEFDGRKDRFDVPPDRCFTGFDAYKQVLASGVDSVILATPPGFRPIHFKAAIEAGKNVFMEKPVCVDPWGYNTVCAAADLAKEKGLAVVAGTQRRHERSRLETMKRIHDGAIGRVTTGQCYWVGRPVHHRGKQEPGMSDIEFQCRNWYNWCWLCGDHIVEQHIHNIDVINWVIGTHPVSAVAVGGRQARQEQGNIWDHFAVEYEYPDGVRVASYCSHFEQAAHRVSERVAGTKGTSNTNGTITGENAWKFTGDNPRGQVQEHADLIAGILARKPLNEARQVAESSMTAVLGRMAAYTGREINWDWTVKASKLRLGPENMHAFGPYQPPPVAVPGETQLV
ncbi:MAG: hypothetical protein AMK72_03230 [Planctomycetes bacterium SM23_25]|nr:MAG: hypothetical protein AMS14_03090 [Planctomycetes bacterium DG_20]KPK49960.1 MAG: hypothetical protein AMK72_03230 [Planctomycetes bacterium SM23_25]